MKILADFRNRKVSMWRKLLLNMLALVLLLLVFIAVGLFFAGQFSTTTQKYSNELSFQNHFFSGQIEKYFDDLSMMSEMLATDSAVLIDEYLDQNDIEIATLNNSQTHTTGVQKVLFYKLREELLKADASGAFILLDATVNTSLNGADKSKTGLYFKRNSLDRTDETLSLLRGSAELGREHDVLPHRKWLLEFKTEFAPDVATFLSAAKGGGQKSELTNVVTLYGTNEKAMLFLTPVYGADGSLYGVCGFEISESYFKNYFAQPTRFEKLICTFSKTAENGQIDCENALWAGVLGGYSLKPSGTLQPENSKAKFIKYVGDSKYVAISSKVTVCETEYTLVVMQPKSEFDKAEAIAITRVILLCVLLVFTAVVLCAVFSKRFVAPVIKSLDRIRRQEKQGTNSDIIEIDDLFVYLAEQDKLRDLETDELKRQNDQLASVTENQTAQIEMLSENRKCEINPKDYETFKIGIMALTKTEKKVFELYLQGKTAGEIIEILGVRESTLKFHNHNILDKLGVSSRKQMLRYAALLKQESQG